MKNLKSNNPRSRQTDLALAGLRPDMPVRPGGKLGLIVQRLERKSGATVGELAEAAGWQGNSVLGALSRLRAQGFAMHREIQGSRRAYRLVRAKKG